MPMQGNAGAPGRREKVRGTAKILPFRTSRSAEPPSGREEDQEDWWLLLSLLAAFAIAVARVVYTVHHHQEFGLDASLALVFVLGVPLLLRESVVNLVGRAVAWLARRRRRSSS
jgi:hypothetical protein